MQRLILEERSLIKMLHKRVPRKESCAIDSKIEKGKIFLR
jgi:hypothetical protein